MNTTIHLLKDKTNNPYDTYETLQNIWENVNNEQFKKSFEKFRHNKNGNIYLIKFKKEVIGITGYYFPNNNKKVIGLRWHGINRTYRNKGISKKAINLLVIQIQRKYPDVKYIQELAPFNEPMIINYFKKQGFKKQNKKARIFPNMPHIKSFKMYKKIQPNYKIFELIKKDKTLSIDNNYKTVLYTEKNFLNSKSLTREMKNFLINVNHKTKRDKWFQEDLDDKEKFICFALYDNDKLIATRFLDYTINDDMYDKVRLKINSQKYLVGSKLVVSPKYQGKGLATKMFNTINKYIFNNFDIDYILGDACNVGALRLYNKYVNLNYIKSDINKIIEYKKKNYYKSKNVVDEIIKTKGIEDFNFNIDLRYYYKREDYK